jgi:circadian clock protein KaiC
VTTSSNPQAPSPDSQAAAARGAGRLILGQDGYSSGAAVPKLPTGISGFDHVAMGGLPSRRATVVAGQSGSAKTLFAAQFLAEGIRLGQPGVFVTLEEPAADLRANLSTLGWDVEQWEADGDWRFVDASPLITASEPHIDVDTLAAQIGHAVDATGADRLALDSVSAVLSLQPDATVARLMLRRLVASLRRMGLTIVLTLETPGDPGGALSAYGVEEFVADNVVLLRNVRESGFRRRTVEVLKMRGAMHHKGDVPFTVVPGRGLVVLPVTSPHDQPNPGLQRVSSGNAGLDELTHGGLFRASSTLISGPTGTGKTLLSTQLAGAGAAQGETVLVMAYEESREQVLANGRTTGHDFAAYEEQGLLHLVTVYPEVASLDDHLVEIRELVERLQPTRVVIDSLSALERLGSQQSYRTFLIGLTSFVRTAGVALVLTATTSQLLGGSSVTESHTSGLIDTIMVLRHVETGSELRRGVVVLRMRGSSHEHQIRELRVGPSGIEIGRPFLGLGGVLTGAPVLMDRQEG